MVLLRILILSLFLYFVNATYLWAQSNDSLLAKLAVETIDSNQVKLLRKLADSYQNANPDSAIIFYDKALAICQTPHLLSFNANLLNQKGIALDILGDAKALKIFEESKVIFEQLKDTLGMGRVEINFGVYYHFRSQHDEALLHYFKALEYFEKIENVSYRAKVLNNIAIQYRLKHKFNRAIEIYQQSLDLKEQLKDTVGIATTLTNMAMSYEQLDDKEKMVRLFEKALTYYQLLGLEEGIAHCRMSMGKAYLEQEEYEKAETNLEIAYPFYQKTPHERDYGYVLNYLARIALHKEEYQQTVDLLEPALENIQSRGRWDISQSTFQSLGIANGKLGNYQASFDYLQEANNLKDSIFEEKRMTLSEEMQTKFDVAQKNKDLEIAALKLERESQQKELYSIGLFFAFLSLLFGGYLLYQKNKNNYLLAQKNTIINQSLKEKELLVTAIENRIDNNMQFISNLLHLQTEHLADDAAILALKESENRVAAMSLLHQNLQRQGQQVDIEIANYLNQLIDNIMSTYEVDKAKIEVAKNIDQLLVDVDRAIPIGLIINELLGGVLKSLIAKNKAGNITISLKEKNQKIFLEMTNNNDSANARQLPIRSFGLKLIDMLVNQLGATWNEMEEAGGRFSISMPK